jgi:hypothetical protein
MKLRRARRSPMPWGGEAMEVKGTAIDATLGHVRAAHGEDGLKRLLAKVSPTSRKLLEAVIMPASWYPIGPGLFEPTQAVCDLFHGGDLEGAWQVGRASADSALTGIYKALVMLVAPRVVVERGPTILATYYRPLKVLVTKLGENNYSLKLSGVDEPSPIFDRRIAGWAQRALEMASAKNIEIDIATSVSAGAPATEIQFRWK